MKRISKVASILVMLNRAISLRVFAQAPEGSNTNYPHHQQILIDYLHLRYGLTK